MKWIIAYDIRDKRRLRRAYRHLCQYALHLQNSVFLLQGDREFYEECKEKLWEIVNKEDDVRIYELPENTEIHNWGKPILPEGIVFQHGIIQHQVGKDETEEEVSNEDKKNNSE